MTTDLAALRGAVARLERAVAAGALTDYRVELRPLGLTVRVERVERGELLLYSQIAAWMEMEHARADLAAELVERCLRAVQERRPT